MTGLRAAHERVTAEDDGVGAKREALRHDRFLRQTVAAQVDERAVPEVLDRRNSMGAADRNNCGKIDLAAAVPRRRVARVYLEQETRAFGDDVFVVTETDSASHAHHA